MKGGAQQDRKSVEPRENILRYVSATAYDASTNMVNASAFERKPKDLDGLSVLRKGIFSKNSDADLRELCTVFSKWWTIRKSGRFAELNVGELLAALKIFERDVSVVADPLSEEGDKPANPAHALVLGLPFEGEAVGSLTSELAGDLIRKLVRKLHEPVAV